MKNAIIKNFLFNRCKEVINIKYLDGKYFIVKGHVQSGKTNFLLTVAFYYYFKNRDIVIVLRNHVDDIEQLKSRLEEYMIDMNIYLQSYKNIPLINIYTNKDIKKKQGPGIILCLANPSQLKTINETMKGSDFILIIDEIDSVDSGLKNKTCNLLQELKDKSNKIFAVSATVLDPSFREDVQSNNVIILTKPENYWGIDTFQFNILEYSAIASNKITDDILDNDDNIGDFLEDEHYPFYIDLYNEYHPWICLFKLGRTIQPQKNLFKYIKKNYSDKYSIILYNGTSVKIYDKEQTIKNNNIGISSAIQHLKDQGVRKHPRIIIITGENGGRGISFVSKDYGQCLKKNTLGWHLTDEYLLFSHTTHIPELLQGCRLCVIKKDNIPLTLHTTDKIKNDIIKGYYLQEELIDRARLSNQGDNISLLSESLSSLLINKKKVPKRKITKTTKYKLNITLNHDSGWDIATYDMNNEENIFSDGDSKEPSLGEIVLILEDLLSSEEKKVCYLAKEFLLDEMGTGSWKRVNELCEKISTKYGRSANQTRAIITHLYQRKKVRACKPDQVGLLLLLKGDHYQIRLN